MAQPMKGNQYNTDPATALSPRQLAVLQKLSPEDQDIFLNSWNDPEDGATEPMGDLLDYRYGNRQGPQLPERGPTQLREEGGLEEQVLRSMGVGGGNPAKGPTTPMSADQGMRDPTGVEMDHPMQYESMPYPGDAARGGSPGPEEQPYNLEGGFDDIPPEVLDKATQMYMEQYGEEGFGGDASMEEVEKIARTLMGGAGGAPTPSVDPKQMILQKMLGGGQGGY